MHEHVIELARLLRSNDVRVSTAEVADAARAVAAIGVGDLRRLRLALAATLVKTEVDRPTFDELFDLYFCRGAALAGALGSGLADAARRAGVDEAAVAELLDALLAEAMGQSAATRMGLGIGAAEMAALIQRAAGEVGLDDIRTPLQVGYYGYRMAEALELGQAEARALESVERASRRAGISTDAGDAVRGEVVKNFAAMRAEIREHVSRVFALENHDYARNLALGQLAEKPLHALSEREITELRRELLRLARALRARFSHRPEVARRGRLDLGRTLRGSLATGGVPFAIHRRQRHRRKPRLVVLCDISDSVRNVSRFMLELVYTLQELFDRVYTFAFVAELGELTDLFRQHDIDRAIELAYGGAVVNTFANSNYGRTLQQFAERHLDKVTGRTTVIVIGDGRNNYHSSRAAILGDIARRARQVMWLTPEPEALWGFGDSAMREYQPHCDRVMVVRNLEALRRVIDELIV